MGDGGDLMRLPVSFYVHRIPDVSALKVSSLNLDWLPEEESRKLGSNAIWTAQQFQGGEGLPNVLSHSKENLCVFLCVTLCPRQHTSGRHSRQFRFCYTKGQLEQPYASFAAEGEKTEGPPVVATHKS